MQPAEKRPNKNQSGISRARMLLKKNMGWLPGFPLSAENGAIQWCTMAVGEHARTVISIDREHLRRMQTTLTKLRHKFPRALPKIVDNVDDWVRRMDALLAILKDIVHQGHEVNFAAWLEKDVASHRWRERFQQLRGRHSQLRRFLEAVAFLQFTGRENLSLNGLNWIGKNAAALSKLASSSALNGSLDALDLQIMLFVLHGDMRPELLDALVECLSESSFWSLPSKNAYAFTQEVASQLRQLVDSKSYVVPSRTPSQSVAESLREMLAQLVQLPPTQRQVASQLAHQLISSDVVSSLRELQQQCEAGERRLLRILRRLDNNESERPQTRSEKNKILNQIHDVQFQADNLFLNELNFAIKHLPQTSRDDANAKNWVRFLELLPIDGAALRLGLFNQWEGMFAQTQIRHEAAKRERDFQDILKQLCNVFGRRGVVHPNILAHWSEFAKKQNRSDDFVRDWVEESLGKEQRQRVIQLLDAITNVQGLSISSRLLSSLSDFVKATSDNVRVKALVEALAKKGADDYFAEQDIRAALKISEEVSNAAAILEVLDDDDEMTEPVAVLAKNIGDDRMRRIVEQFVLHRNKKALFRLAAATQLVSRIGRPIPLVASPDVTMDWVHCYPDKLHQDLRDLGGATEEAAEIANRLLGKDLPRIEDTRREMNSLERLLEGECDQAMQSRMQIRLNNLQRRIESPQAISPSRLQNLQAKIRARADQELVSRFLEACNRIAADHMQAEFSLGQLPEELFSPPNDQLLSSIMRLTGTTRDLGLRLLLKNSRNPMIGFEAEEQNIAFRERLESLGINWQPWLGDSFEGAGETSEGEHYRLSFTRDVSDFLLMGYHFGTCLSPQSFNFFSTIANAVDINKQVVYGRTEAGRIIGRCLFTLTDHGAILTYYRYSHDRSDNFASAVDDFALRLAEEMNTTLGPAGKVSTLVSTQWYDDGAVPNSADLNLHSPESPIRQALQIAPPHEVLGELQNLLGPSLELRSILGQLLFIDEFSQRPAIVEPFIECFGFDLQVPFNQRLRLAILAGEAGLRELANEVIQSLQPSRLAARLKRSSCDGCEAFHGVGSYREVFGLLTDFSPTIALRAIRGSRPRRVREDTDDPSRQRTRALAQIYRSLGRDKLADKLQS